MLRVATLFLAVIALGADEPKKDAKADNLEGSWLATSFIDHGNKVDSLDQLKITLTLKGGKYTVKSEGNVVDEGEYKVDASKNPKEMDTIPAKGDNKGKVDHGIYELKGDTLKTAFDDIAKQKRPDTFDSQKFQVVEFKRVKE